MAQAPIPQYYRKPYQQLDGGLCTRINPTRVPANKFVQLDNAILADHDILEKVQGYTIDGSPFPNSSDSFIRMLSNYRVGNTVNSLVVAASDASNTNVNLKVDLKQTFGNGQYNYIGYTVGTAVFDGTNAVVGTGTAWAENVKAGDKIGTGALPTTFYEIASVNSDTSITLVSGSYPTGTGAYMSRVIWNNKAIPVSLVVNNKLLITNGIDSVAEFDNTTMSLISTAPLGTMVCLHKNRVFMAGMEGDGSQIAWSKVNDETTWDESSVEDVYPQDNGIIVGIVSFANSLIVFKDNGKVYQVVGEFDQDVVGYPTAIRRIDIQDNIGIIAGKTAVVNDDNTLYFLAQTGYYAITGNYGYLTVTKVSWDIEPTIANLVFQSTAAAPEQFAYTSKTNWDTGTLVGLTDTRITNAIAPYFDTQTISAPYNFGANPANVYIDSSNNTYSVWNTGANTINYTLWKASDNTTVHETVLNVNTYLQTALGTTTTYTLRSLAISVAPNGNIGIASLVSAPYGSGIPPITICLYSEFASGTWNTYIAWNSGAPVNIEDTNPGGYATQIIFSGSSTPCILFTIPWELYGFAPSTSIGLGYAYGTHANTVTIFGINSIHYTMDAAMAIDSSGNINVAAVGTNALSLGEIGIYYFYSSNGGASFSTPLTSSSLGVTYLVPAGTSPVYNYASSIAVGIDDLGNTIIVSNCNGYSTGDGGYIVRYNVTPPGGLPWTSGGTPSKTTVTSPVWTPSQTGTYTLQSNNAISPSYLKGYVNNNGIETYYVQVNGRESFIYDIPYTVGTATFNGTTTVVGTGTKWTTWVMPGDTIRLSADQGTDAVTVQSVNADNSITLTSAYGGTSTTGTYIAKRTIAITDSGSTQYLDTAYNWGIKGLASNGSVLATMAVGYNASTLFCRRVSTIASFSTGVLHDPELTAWGTYQVNPVRNNSTIVYECGVSASSSIPASTIDLISPGTIISTNDDDLYVQSNVTFQLNDFQASILYSLLLNYTGSAPSGCLPNGFVFNNDMYVGVCENGNSVNNKVLFLDRKHAWGDALESVTVFARMLQTLYAGSSTNGNVYKMRTGYDMAGSDYSLIAVTKEDMLGSLELTKDVSKVYLQYVVQTSGTFTFSYRLDNYQSSAGSAWVDFTVDQITGNVTDSNGNNVGTTIPGFAEIPIGQTCSSIQFKIEQDDAGVQVGFIGFTVLYGYNNLR